MQRRTLVLLALLGSVSSGLNAQWAGWDYDFDQEKKPWNEMQAQIPPYPKGNSLIPFETGGAVRHQIFIDANSISRGEDGVMRYTAVIKAAGGATNVTFEGMRCETREHKLYALGHNDGTWARARDPQWKFITAREMPSHYVMLFRDFMCPSRYLLPEPRNVGAALKRGEPISPTTQNRGD
jgi:hypothetical protein